MPRSFHVVSRSVPSVAPILLGVLALLLVAIALTTGRAGAHAELVRAEPPPDALLGAAPLAVQLWFSEPIDIGGTSLQLVDSDGNRQAIGAPRLDPNDPRRVTSSLPPLGPGTYTLSWTNRSAADGHVLSGSFAFRVAGGRAPGAATVEGETPRPWAVVTRWLTFLGAALAAGGGFVALMILAGQAATARRPLAAAIGALVALLASVAEPVLTTIWPPAGARAPTLLEAIRGLPAAWWWRPAALAPLLIAAVLWWQLRRRGRAVPRALPALALVLGLAALLGLALTGHGAGRADWRWLAGLSDIGHQWAIALWVGGLVHLGLWASPGQAAGERGPVAAPVRRFSAWALGLALVGITTGLLNAGLILPHPARLWDRANRLHLPDPAALPDSDYGRVLLAKLLLLVPVFLLATFHRRLLRRAKDVLAPVFRASLRVETMLAAAVVLGGSTLALLAPPVLRAGVLARAEVTLAAPLAADGRDDDPKLTLSVAPAHPGPNTITVAARQPAGPANGGPVLNWQPLALPPTAVVALTFTSLDQPVAPARATAAPDGTGAYRLAGLDLSVAGWWRVDVLLRPPTAIERQASFYLLLPDPNVNGEGAVPTPPSNGDARALFARGLASQTGLHRVRYDQTINDGQGNLAMVAYAVDDGSDGTPIASSATTVRSAAIRIGDREWIRTTGNGPWNEAPAGPFLPPSQWGDSYQGATGFRLGRAETIDGESCRIVTFVVPGSPRQAAAWYAWWVGESTGHLRHELMVSRFHYMVNHFFDFDGKIVITPPTNNPSATPAATSAAFVPRRSPRRDD